MSSASSSSSTATAPPATTPAAASSELQVLHHLTSGAPANTKKVVKMSDRLKLKEQELAQKQRELGVAKKGEQWTKNISDTLEGMSKGERKELLSSLMVSVEDELEAPASAETAAAKRKQTLARQRRERKERQEREERQVGLWRELVRRFVYGGGSSENVMNFLEGLSEADIKEILGDAAAPGISREEIGNALVESGSEFGDISSAFGQAGTGFLSKKQKKDEA